MSASHWTFDLFELTSFSDLHLTLNLFEAVSDLRLTSDPFDVFQLSVQDVDRDTAPPWMP